MPKIILTKGLPASGKSTFAREWVKEDPVNRKRVCRDDLRLMMHNIQYMPDNKKDLKVLEYDITTARNNLITTWMNEGNDIVIDECNLNPKYNIEDEMKITLDFLEIKDYIIEWKDFTDVPVQVCIKRDALRENPTGAKVIKAAYFKYLTDTNLLDSLKRQGDIISKSDKKAIIVDLDGTLSHIVDRSPYDGEKCAGDMFDPTVMLLVMMFYDKGYEIIFLSGRERTPSGDLETRRWLDKHVGDHVKGYSLFMREEGDHRKDYIIKKEIYDENIKENWDVLFSLDDRNQIVDMWRSMGIKCLQVESGDF